MQPQKRKKRKARLFSRRLAHGAANKKAKSAASPSTQTPSSISPTSNSSNTTATPHRQSFIHSSSAAKRKYTSADYKAELQSVTEENKRLRSDLESAQRKLISAESKNNKLSTAHQLSLERARESNKALSATEATIQSQEKQLQLNNEKTQELVQKAVMVVKDKAKVTTDQEFSCSW